MFNMRLRVKVYVIGAICVTWFHTEPDKGMKLRDALKYFHQLIEGVVSILSHLI